MRFTKSIKIDHRIHRRFSGWYVLHSKVWIKLLLIGFILNATTACSQTETKTTGAMNLDSEKIQILNLARRLTQLMIDKDTAGLNEILDPQFTLTHITGYVQPKDEWFAEIQSERMKYYSYKEVKTFVELNGDQATFMGQNLLDARIWGTRNNWRLQQTMELQKRSRRWVIISSVATIF